MKSKTLLFCYFFFLIAEIVAEVLFFQTNNVNLVYVTKPLLMPILIVWAFLFAKENTLTLSNYIIFALMFSLFGDVTLMLLPINSNFFIAGLACFLVTHLIYIALFIKIPTKNKSILLKRPYLIFPFIAYISLLIWCLYQQNNHEFIKMQIPVLVYGFVILCMLFTAVSCYGKTSTLNYRLIVSGALLFVISDTTIALSKFTSLFENNQEMSRLIIMSLYGCAQFLIVKGYICSNKKGTIAIHQ